MQTLRTYGRIWLASLLFLFLLLLAIMPVGSVYALNNRTALGHKSTPPPHTVDRLHVQGNRIVNSSGQIVILRGVTRLSLEYQCPNGDGHFTTQDFQTMRSWGINAVRFTLNSDYWLYGDPTMPGCTPEAYHRAVDDAVQHAEVAGLAPILVLQWIGNDTQRYLPKRDGVTFWQQVATRYANDPAVMFTPYAEPNDALLPTTGRLTWAQWRDGIPCADAKQPARSECGAIGMQTMVQIINTAAPNHVVFISGNNYATNLDGLKNGADGQVNGYRLAGANLVYEVHLYDEWGPTHFAPILPYVPVIAGEYGIQVDQRDFVETEQRAFEQYGTGYFAWAWNTGDPHSLLSTWDGTPSVFGQHVRDFLLSLRTSLKPIVLPDAAVWAAPGKAAAASDPCPGQWTCDDIGYGTAFGGTPPDGTQSIKGGTVTIQAAGSGLYGNYDTSRMIWQYAAGDGSVSARVVSQNSKNANGLAGVMVREEWNANAPFYAVVITAQGQLKVISRATFGANVTVQNMGTYYGPIFLRVAHTGTTFTAAIARDGTHWTTLARSATTLAITQYGLIAGITASSGTGNTVTSATFDTIAITPSATVAA